MRTKTIAGITVLVLALAGCGGGSAGGGSTGGRTTSITVGYVPYSDDVALFLAKDKGMFTRHGLTVSLVAAANPTAVVASMLSGQEQFGFVTTPVLVNANTKGTAMKCVSSVDGQQPTDPSQDSTALVAAKGSGIGSVRDLVGKKLGTVQLASLNSLAVQILAKRSGIDPNGIQQVVIPFPQMPAALRQGHVQAAVIVSPYVDTAIAQGATVINHPNVELFGGGTVTCLSALSSYIDKHGGTVSAFHAAMNEAIAYAQSHQQEAKAGLTRHMDLSETAAQQQQLSTNWDPRLRVETVAQIQAYMLEFGQISTTVPAASMVWAPAGK